jgi:hypothetical protein
MYSGKFVPFDYFKEIKIKTVFEGWTVVMKRGGAHK